MFRVLTPLFYIIEMSGWHTVGLGRTVSSTALHTSIPSKCRGLVEVYSILLYHRNVEISFRSRRRLGAHKGGGGDPKSRQLRPLPRHFYTIEIEVSVLTKGGRRSQIQTTSPTIRYRDRGLGAHKGGGGDPKSRQLRLLLNRFEVSVLTKGG